MMSSEPAPRPSSAAQALGYAGLIPFVGIALAALLVPVAYRELAAVALLTYAAVIVSFLGGIHWGMVMVGNTAHGNTVNGRTGEPYTAPTKQLAWGVTPSLLGWAALLCPAHWGLIISAASLVVAYLVDARTYPQAGAQGWLPMRLALTTVATVSCLMTAGTVWVVLRSVAR
jgi:hypothetical protein